MLRGIEGIAIYFTDRDVVRHRLVQKIILAYEKYYRRESPIVPAAKHIVYLK